MPISILREADIHLPLTFFTILCGSLTFLCFESVFAHNFSFDDNVNFLTSVDKIRTESNLAADDAGNKDDLILAQFHANNALVYFDSVTKKELLEKNTQIANELDDQLNNLMTEVKSQKSKTQVIETVENIEDILDEAISTRIDKEQINNSTIQALVFANMINTALKNYGDAFDIGIDLTNMSNLKDNTIIADLYNRPSDYKEQNNKVLNFDKYESALGFYDVALKRFFNEITLSLQTEENFTEKQSYLTELENGLIDLKESMEKKANAMKVMEIVHTQIHPNLQTLFNLKLN